MNSAAHHLGGFVNSSLVFGKIFWPAIGTRGGRSLQFL
jgi:hypothetical protein